MYSQYTLLQQNYEIFKFVDLKGYCSHWAVIGTMCVWSQVCARPLPHLWLKLWEQNCKGTWVIAGSG